MNTVSPSWETASRCSRRSSASSSAPLCRSPRRPSRSWASASSGNSIRIRQSSCAMPGAYFRAALVTRSYRCLAPVRPARARTSCGVAGFCDKLVTLAYPCLAPVRVRSGRGRGGHVGEGVAEEPLRRADLIQVLRDPAEEERPAGAEQEARVDVGGFADDAFFEEEMNLVGHGFEDVLDDLLPGSRLVFEHDRLIAVGDRRQRR